MVNNLEKIRDEKAESSDIDHNATTNTHNLTSDISHDSISNVSADDHHSESHNIESHPDTSVTGLQLTNTFTQTATNTSSIANNINQSVKTSASPTFTGLSVGADTDTTVILGRTVLGYANYSDYAWFSHHDQILAGQYALLQSATGRTYLNASSGEMIYFLIAGASKMIMSTAKLSMTIGIEPLYIKTQPNHADSRFGIYTGGGSTTHIGYIEIRDSAGTTRRVAVISAGC